MKSPRIQAIEFTLFEVSIPNIAADPSGFGVWYEPGIGTPKNGLVSEFSQTMRSLVNMFLQVARHSVDVGRSSMAHALLNKPALERERHYQMMRRLTKHVGEAGIGALDIALWDLAGKCCGLSIAQMLEVIVGIYLRMRAQFMGMSRKGA